MVSLLHFHTPSAKKYVKTLLKFSDVNILPTCSLKEAQLCLLQQQQQNYEQNLTAEFLLMTAKKNSDLSSMLSCLQNMYLSLNSVSVY